MTAKTEAEHADLYDDIICRLKFEPLTRAEQYAQIDRAVAAERERCIRIVEAYQVPVGNSAAGEMAAEWTMEALREVRTAIRAEAKGE